MNIKNLHCYDKIKKLNKGKLLAIGTLTGVVAFSGCMYNNLGKDSYNAENKNSTYEEFDDEISLYEMYEQELSKDGNYSARLVFENEEYAEEDRVCFITLDDNQIHGGFSSKDGDVTELIVTKDYYVTSYNLNLTIPLSDYNITDDEEYVVSVDYLSKEIDITTQKLNNEKTK